MLHVGEAATLKINYLIKSRWLTKLGSLRWGGANFGSNM